MTQKQAILLFEEKWVRTTWDTDAKHNYACSHMYFTTL